MWHANSNIDYQAYFIIFHTATSELEVESENAKDQRREGKTIPRIFLVVSVPANKVVIEADNNYGHTHTHTHTYVYSCKINNSMSLLQFSSSGFHYIYNVTTYSAYVTVANI